MAELLYYNLTKEMPPSLGHRQIALSDLLQLQEGELFYSFTCINTFYCISLFG